MIPDPEGLATDIKLAVDKWNAQTPRGQQTLQHRIGVSDIGNCREYVRWMTVQQPFSDDPGKWEAFIGSWVGRGVEEAVAWMFPKTRTGVEITVTLPSGASYVGHPDLVLPGGVLDIKTVDGLTGVKRNGPTEQQQFQRHLYAAGLVQAGLVDEDCFVGNVWFDRSGREATPHVQVESYDPTWLDRADEWLSDVIYAVRNNERTFKDRPIEWCEVACPFFSVCRADDIRKDRESQGLITDPFTLDYVEALVEAKVTKKQAEKVIEDARRNLAGVSGTTGTHIVRWVFVDESAVPGYNRAAYHKLDVRKIR